MGKYPSSGTLFEVGSHRVICHDDDSKFNEAVTQNIPKQIFSYKLWDFSNDLIHAIKYAKAYFAVEAIDEHKSLLKWYFAFRPNNFACRLPLDLYMKNSFDAYMRQGLKDIKAYIELN